MTATLRDSLMELSEEVRVVDLHARVLRGSRKVRLRNRAIAAVAAFLAISGSAVAVAALRPSPSPEPDPTTSPTHTPSPAPSPTPDAILPNVDIRNATLQVPAFPDDPRCPAASHAFKDGKVIVGGKADEQVTLTMQDPPVRADVDGQPGDEILTRLSCSAYSYSAQVLAVKVSPDGTLTPLGFVLMSGDHRSFDIVTESLRVENGIVLVDVLGPDRPDGLPSVMDLQTRGYAYRGGKFEQVSGPAKFAVPPSDYRRVDFRNVTAEVILPGSPPGAPGYVKLSDGKGRVTINKVTYEVTVLSTAFFDAQGPGPGLVNVEQSGAVLYRLVSTTGEVRTFVNVYRMPTGIPAWLIGVIKDQNDLAGATKVETSGSELRVTVNGKVKTYRQEPDSNWVSSA